MNIVKKIIATLTAWQQGREHMPDRKPGISQAQKELELEQNLAREREAMQRERMKMQQGVHQRQESASEGVEEETIEIPEEDGRAA